MTADVFPVMVIVVYQTLEWNAFFIIAIIMMRFSPALNSAGYSAG